jgi:hypothetical protein
VTLRLDLLDEPEVRDAARTLVLTPLAIILAYAVIGAIGLGCAILGSVLQ